jgi:uncharacterized membrane protein
MANARSANRGRLALFAIFSLATASAVSTCEPSGISLPIVVGLPVVLFIASTVLDRFDLGYIARLGQLLTGFGLVFVGVIVDLTLSDKIAFFSSALIAMAIPAMTWPVNPAD